MPIYEYECRQCGPFEHLQSISDPPLKKCPRCRSKVTRLISAAAFHLKGGGWYADGYQKKNGAASSASATTTKSEPAKAEGSAPSESSAKPAGTKGSTDPS